MPPAWKVRLGHLVVELSAVIVSPYIKKTQHVKFWWWYSNQTWTKSSSNNYSHFTGITCPGDGTGSKCRKYRAFLVHLSRRLKCTIVIMRCPSSVRPSSLTFHIFDFSSETTKQNSTKLKRKQDLNVLYQDCVFRADRKNKMAAMASDWLRHFRLLFWNHWTEFNETWQEARSQRPLPSLCFSGRSKKKMAALASDWLRHFRLLLWNRVTEFNETWQEVRSQRPLPSLCFSGWSEKQDGCHGLWLAETFSTSPLKPLNGIQQNLTGSKISTSSTKFVFFGPIGKTRWLPWPLIGWDIFDFSSETAERNSTKLDRKQDLNVLYQVCVFRADRTNKMTALASDWLRHFRLLLWNRWMEFNKTWQEARSQHPRALPSLCFSGRSVNKMSALADSSKGWHIVLRCTISLVSDFECVAIGGIHVSQTRE